jgi:GNAT superfamily N-acetyltransferase
LVLAHNERWNQCEQDWKTILRLSPKGSFAAWVERSLIGTVTTFKYGADLAWVGMMIVQRELRGRGIGRNLMQVALDHLKACGVSTIKLDATPAGQPLYTALGFRAQATIHRWEAVLPQAPRRDSGLGSGTNNLRTTIHEFDQRAFGMSRRQLLNQLIEQCCVVPAVLTGATSRALLGYGLARHGADAFYIGPMVAKRR